MKPATPATPNKPEQLVNDTTAETPVEVKERKHPETPGSKSQNVPLPSENANPIKAANGEHKELPDPVKTMEQTNYETSEKKEGSTELPKKERKKRPLPKGGKSSKSVETPSKTDKKHVHTETKLKKKKETKKKEEKFPADVTLSPAQTVSLPSETSTVFSSFFLHLWHQLLFCMQPTCRFHK